MYNLSIKTWWISTLFILIWYAGNGQKIIQDVILIDIEPYEVRMTEDGKILDRINYLPNYFKDYEAKKGKTYMLPESNIIVAQSLGKEELPSEDPPIPEVKVNIKETIELEKQEVVVEKSFPNQYNVFFEQGKATLSNDGINVLDQLAEHMLSQPDVNVIAITFFYEPVTIAQLLSQRRREACISYLKIKGVDVDEHVVKGSISQSQVNKVYFGLKSK
jgi:outer membrane protein OmpA-like peptidoglycan-associated protein